MVIRVFRARTKSGAFEECARLAEQIAIPFVDQQRGLIARHTGKGIGATGEELIMISVWEDLEAMKNMTGDDWESAVMPDERLAELIEETFLHQYESIG